MIRMIVAAFLLSTSLAIAAVPAVATSRPNIVVMLVDNLGYGDIGAYGGGELRGAPTPAIDRLAAEGMRLTNFNVEPECTPSRAALLTGRMPIRSGLAIPVAGPGVAPGLSPWEYTLAELLRDAGYRTAMFGKWHLGETRGRLPNDQGFGEWWGFPKSSAETLAELQPGWTPEVAPPQPLLEGRAGEESRQVGVYDYAMRPLMDTAITERAVNWIRQHAGRDQPFFLYVPFSLPHTPALANPRFRQPGNTDYQNALREIDANTGAILEALQSAGAAEDTLVVWASDNGPETLQGVGVQYGAQADPGPFRGEFPSGWEGAIRTPGIVRWPGKVPAGRSSNEMVSILDLYATIAHAAGAAERVPRDRAMDSIDQFGFLTGTSERSAREHLMVFYDNELLAMKWRQFKVHFVLRETASGTVAQAGQGVVHGYKRVLAYPWVFNLENDPKELWNISGTSQWITRPLAEIQRQYAISTRQFPNLQPGQLQPSSP